jgi:hypothetical protein
MTGGVASFEARCADHGRNRAFNVGNVGNVGNLGNVSIEV